MSELKVYEALSCKDIEDIIKGNIKTINEKFGQITSLFIRNGYYLKRQYQEEMYVAAGYEKFEDYVKDVYGKSKSWATRMIQINEKFSEGGNSPNIDEKYSGYCSSQLQEMLYLNDKQLEEVKPEMTVKEIREIKKSKEEEHEEEKVSILGYPLRVYPENSLIKKPGCHNQDCYNCHRDGCELRQEKCYCVEAPMGNPFPCTILNIVKKLREEVGSRCQFVNEDLAKHRARDGQPVPCCKMCNNPCGYECRRSSEQRNKKVKEEIAKSKSEETKDELWFIKEYAKRNKDELHRIMQICQAHKNNTDRAIEIQKKLAPYGYRGCGSSEFSYTMYDLKKGIEFEAEKNKCQMEYVHFVKKLMELYDPFSAEFLKQNKYKSVATSQQEHSVNTESEQIPGQMDVYDYQEVIPEDMQQSIAGVEYKEVEEKKAETILTYLVEAVLEALDVEEMLKGVTKENEKDTLQDKLVLYGTVYFIFCSTNMTGEFLDNIEIYKRDTGTLFKTYTWQQFFEEFDYITSMNERTNQESIIDEFEEKPDVLSEVELLRKMLQEEKNILSEAMKYFDENDVYTKRQKIKTVALASLLFEWEDKTEPEQPELPTMKNNDQRKEFLESYKTWPVWFEVPEASETYYRFDLPDGSSIVICEYRQYIEWKTRYGENPESTFRKEYLLKPGCKYLHDCVTNQSALIEHLKKVQKR